MGNHQRPTSSIGSIMRQATDAANQDELQTARNENPAMSADSVMSWQRTIGNQAVMRMLNGSSPAQGIPASIQRFTGSVASEGKNRLDDAKKSPVKIGTTRE